MQKLPGSAWDGAAPWMSPEGEDGPQRDLSLRCGCCLLSGHLSRQISTHLFRFTEHNFNAHGREMASWQWREKSAKSVGLEGWNPPGHPSAAVGQQDSLLGLGKCLGRKTSIIQSGFRAFCSLCPRGVAGEQHSGLELCSSSCSAVKGNQGHR